MTVSGEVLWEVVVPEQPGLRRIIECIVPCVKFLVELVTILPCPYDVDPERRAQGTLGFFVRFFPRLNVRIDQMRTRCKIPPFFIVRSYVPILDRALDSKYPRPFPSSSPTS